MTFQAETISGRDTDPCHSFLYRGPHVEPAQKTPHRSRISNGHRFDPRKIKPSTSMARHYADIQAELLRAAGPVTMARARFGQHLASPASVSGLCGLRRPEAASQTARSYSIQALLMAARRRARLRAVLFGIALKYDHLHRLLAPNMLLSHPKLMANPLFKHCDGLPQRQAPR
jgi:hypothetical protein